MGHISTAVEYALHCLLCLVDLPAEIPAPSSRDLAELRALPVRYVATTMTKLQKAKIVVTTEGVRGGIRLARPAEEVSFLDVILAVDGPRPLFRCRNVRRACALFGDSPPDWAIQGVCSIHAVMIEAEARMSEVLRSKTLRHMAEASAIRVPAQFKQDAYAWLVRRNRERLMPIDRLLGVDDRTAR